MIAPKSYNEQKHDPAKLVEEHMALVQRLAWHFQGRVGRFVEIEDLLQAGYLGLIKASQRYSVREGVTFAAYAAIRIRGAIIDLLRRNSNLCRSTITMRQTIERTRRDLTQKLGRVPDPEQVAEAAGLTTEELLEWQNRFQVNLLQSLDEVYTDHSLIFESAEGAAEDKLEMTQLKGVLKLCIEKLPEREAMVLQFYYVEELNVYEIAAILNVTTGRVSQIKKAAVEPLRTLITAQLGDV